jgi:hypothetical protein
MFLSLILSANKFETERPCDATRYISRVTSKGLICFTVKLKQKGPRQANQFRHFTSLMTLFCPLLTLLLSFFGQGPKPLLDAETNST